MIKAIVKIKQEKITERKIIIVAEIDINGNKSVKQFSLDKGFNNAQKQEQMSKKIKEDYKFEKRNSSFSGFEVEL